MNRAAWSRSRSRSRRYKIYSELEPEPEPEPELSKVAWLRIPGVVVCFFFFYFLIFGTSISVIFDGFVYHELWVSILLEESLDTFNPTPGGL